MYAHFQRLVQLGEYHDHIHMHTFIHRTLLRTSISINFNFYYISIFQLIAPSSLLWILSPNVMKLFACCKLIPDVRCCVVFLFFNNFSLSTFLGWQVVYLIFYFYSFLQWTNIGRDVRNHWRLFKNCRANNVADEAETEDDDDEVGVWKICIMRRFKVIN